MSLHRAHSAISAAPTPIAPPSNRSVRLRTRLSTLASRNLAEQHTNQKPKLAPKAAAQTVSTTHSAATTPPSIQNWNSFRTHSNTRTSHPQNCTTANCQTNSTPIQQTKTTRSQQRATSTPVTAASTSQHPAVTKTATRRSSQRKLTVNDQAIQERHQRIEVLNAVINPSYSRVTRQEIAQEQYFDRVTSSPPPPPPPPCTTQLTLNPTAATAESDSNPSYSYIINQCYDIPRTVPQSLRQEFTACMAAALTAYIHHSARQNHNGMLTAFINFISIPRLTLSSKRSGKLSSAHELKKRKKRIHSITQLLTLRHDTVVQTESNVDNQHTTDRDDTEHTVRQHHAESKCITAVRRLLKGGHISRATRRLTQPNNSVIVAMDAQQTQTMQQLHPHRNSTDAAIPPIPSNSHPVLVEPTRVASLVKQLNNGSASGPSGLSFEMLSLLVNDNTCLTGIARIVDDCVNGRLTQQFKPYLLSSQLIGIAKPNGGLRPIAMNECIMKLASCYALSTVDVNNLPFADIQFGVKRAVGIEEMIHSLREELTVTNQNNAGMVIDFKNAFNAVDRATVLKTLYSHSALSGLWRIADFAYSQPTALYSRCTSTNRFMQSLMSEEGVRQGDPLSSLLFALSIQSTLAAVDNTSVKVRAYLDDVIVVGKPQGVVNAFETICVEAAKCKLQVQPKKCCFIYFNEATVPLSTNITEYLNNKSIPVHSHTTQLLGTVIGRDDSAVQQQLSHLVETQHTEFFNRLNSSLLTLQEAALFLRLSTIPKMNYLMRVSPPTVIQQACKWFDARAFNTFTLKAKIAERLKTLRTEDKATYSRVIQQLNLPISMRGFSLRCTFNLSPICFISSLLRVMSLQTSTAFWTAFFHNSIHSNQLNNSIHYCIDFIKTLINNTSICNKLLPASATAQHVLNFAHSHQSDTHTVIETLQKLLTHAMDINTTETLHTSIAAIEDSNKQLIASAHWTAIKPAHCHDWLKASPMSTDLTLSDREFQFAVRLRLNLPPDDFTTASTKCICGFTLHNDHYHALCCSKVSAIERHNHVRDLFARQASKLFITCSREPTGFFSADNRRPDLLFHFSHKQTFVDFTIVHPTAKSNLRFATDSGRVCREAEHLKNEKYKELTTEHSFFDFLPIVFTTFGEWGKKTNQFIEEIAVLGSTDDCPYDNLDLRPELTHSIAVTIQKFNARMHHEMLLKIAHFNSNKQIRTGTERRAQARQTEREILELAGEA